MLGRVDRGRLPRQVLLRALLVAPEADPCPQLEAFFTISTEVEMVARTESEGRALQLFFLVQPDITILDWRVGEPARFVGLLKRVAPDARAIVLVPSYDSPAALAARVLGADAVVTPEDVSPCLGNLVDAAEAARAARAAAAYSGLAR